MAVRQAVLLELHGSDCMLQDRMQLGLHFNLLSDFRVPDCSSVCRNCAHDELYNTDVRKDSHSEQSLVNKGAIIHLT
ncbi:hypothetical protein BDFB_000814 [Asbolus verrucosus]|uniref:Uncharacterized protein n=1 Tax=Asbolus verrucosus TaxID=1661398 RepID=A0A482VSR2_ASBVE|nr:hypothetical protein BDFB_000814 [Asbolus verrucosus]